MAGPWGPPRGPPFGYPPGPAFYPGPAPYFQPPPQQAPPPAPPPVVQPQPAPAGGVPYIGARISLVSNLNIRYEGTLYTIDPKEVTVALQNVRCFGTEGREASKEERVEPSGEVWEFIIFRGKDIKDLHVCEPSAAPKPKPPMDPAIVSTNVAPRTGPGAPAPRPEGPVGVSSLISPADRVVEDKSRAPPTAAAAGPATVPAVAQTSTPAPAAVAAARPAQAPAQSQGAAPAKASAPAGAAQGQAQGQAQDGAKEKDKEGYSGPGTGNFLKRGARPHGHGHGAGGAAAAGSVPSDDFDFAQANAHFNKEAFKAQMSQEAKKPEPSKDGATPDDAAKALAGLAISGAAPTGEKVGPKYDKSKGFWDEISTDRDSRDAPRSDEMRQRDSETFGEAALRRGRRGGFHRNYGGGGGGGGGYRRDDRGGGGQRDQRDQRDQRGGGDRNRDDRDRRDRGGDRSDRRDDRGGDRDGYRPRRGGRGRGGQGGGRGGGRGGPREHSGGQKAAPAS